MSALQDQADYAYARQPSHVARLDRARVALHDRAGWTVLWSGGKDSTVCLALAAELWDSGYVVMSDNGADPCGRRDLQDKWVRLAPHLTFVSRPSHPDDEQDRKAHTRLITALGTPGVVLGLRAAESGYRRRIARTLIRDGEYQTANRWGALPALCPILDWSLNDVWAFLQSRHLPVWGVYGDRADRSPRSTVRNSTVRAER